MLLPARAAALHHEEFAGPWLAGLPVAPPCRGAAQGTHRTPGISNESFWDALWGLLNRSVFRVHLLNADCRRQFSPPRNPQARAERLCTEGWAGVQHQVPPGRGGTRRGCFLSSILVHPQPVLGAAMTPNPPNVPLCSAP